LTEHPPSASVLTAVFSLANAAAGQAATRAG